MEEGEERDVYVQQLKEVFLSCARNGGHEESTEDTGDTLNKVQLHELCIKLQVEEQADRIIEELIGHNKNSGVRIEFS